MIRFVFGIYEGEVLDDLLFGDDILLVREENKL